ncbi:uncharacterized protein LOC117289574 [Asterias rubens]|uniref:uncharacterized protein LOC117289574 n=1 Tax=Asterias rubens TaxID=7604 RepID=UPI0014552A55|nr:uncharacterized protein LOC117289574 [Asterias rubens]
MPVYYLCAIVIPLLHLQSVVGKLTPWCGVIDYALVDRNYTTINATKNQKLCYQACLKDSPRCRSANYRPRDQECDLNCASHFDVCAGGGLVEQSGSLYTFTASEIGCLDSPAPTCCEKSAVFSWGDKGSEWKLIFKGVAGTGIKLYDLWTNTTDVYSECCGHCCGQETLFNYWKNERLNVKRVKLSLYDHTGVKVELVFNGTADVTSWFAKERLVSSPWSDLTPTAKTIYFSVFGEVTDGLVDRRFYISKEHNGCPYDLGWMVVVDSKRYCEWEQGFSSYPAIMYSTINTAVNWKQERLDKTLGIADYLTIHIDTE